MSSLYVIRDSRVHWEAPHIEQPPVSVGPPLSFSEGLYTALTVMVLCLYTVMVLCLYTVMVLCLLRVFGDI